MCEAFQVEDLALMIRATRGRSRRPNHMHSHLDALQAMPPVNFRRLASDFHSVAKQASFYIAFGTDLQGFFFVFLRCWGDFGGFGEAKMRPKIDFWDVFFSMFFWIAFWHRSWVDF